MSSPVSDPVAPARLDLQLGPAQPHHKSLFAVLSGSALTVSWTLPAGHVDWYDVTLEDTSSGSRRRTRIMGSAASQTGFTSLIPGTMYKVSVVASAGNKSASPVHAMTATGELQHLRNFLTFKFYYCTGNNSTSLPAMKFLHSEGYVALEHDQNAPDWLRAYHMISNNKNKEL